MKNYLYFIKWNEKCLSELGINNAIHDDSGGLLMQVDGDYRDLVNKALECNFTVYARYYKFHIIKYGPINALKNIIKPLDLWIEGEVMNLVINPLGIDVETMARIFLNLGFNMVLISEDDVEYSIDNG